MTDSPATAAIVVAGGSGERLGRVGGKQLVAVAGWPVLSWSLRAVAAAPEVSFIVVVCPEERTEEYDAEAVRPIGISHPVAFAASGATRQASVRAGLERISEDFEYVIVHDGARPLVTPEVFSRCLATLELRTEAAGAIVGHPSFDTLKIVDGDRIESTPERARYWAVQTPQVFRRRSLVAAHAAALESGFEGTDDASLVERLGETVLVVPGPRDNVKVTVAEDLAYVNAVLGKRRAGEG